MSDPMALSIAVLWGGRSGEAEVSRASAEAVTEALRQVGHHVRLVELSPRLASELMQDPPKVVFPLTHGTLGEDGCLQGLLEILELPYVGSGVRASAVAAHKPTAKRLWRWVGLPVADEWVVARGEALGPLVPRIRERLGAALVIKPASGGSAIGVRRLADEASDAEVAASLEAALLLDSEALVEPWLEGTEVTCGVLDSEEGAPVALPSTLIFPRRAGFYDFASKYAPGGSEHRCPAPLAPKVNERVQAAAVKAHVTIGARDLSRADFLVRDPEDDASAITLLETNTLPGMTSTSLFPEQAAVHGLAFSRLCDRLVRRAMDRFVLVRPDVLEIPQ